MSNLLVEAIPAFADNYIWLIYNKNTPEAWIVDPGDAFPVLDRLKQRSLVLRGILITHHHGDHINGIPALLDAFPNARVIGPKHAKIPWVTEVAAADAHFLLYDDFPVNCLAVPGHTLEHVAYISHPDSNNPMVLCGDTLFSSGCGRLFEGSPETMWRSLKQLMALHPSTKVYAAHEYTQANLTFSAFLLPQNPAIKARKHAVDLLRSQQTPSLPSTMALELKTNPFLMVEQGEVIEAVNLHVGGRCAKTMLTGATTDSAAAVFKIIRQMKDQF